MRARIVRIVSKDYTVQFEDGSRAPAVAMGKLRQKQSPVVGDIVDISIGRFT